MLPALFRVPDSVALVGSVPVPSFAVAVIAAFLLAGWFFVRGLRGAGHPTGAAWSIVVAAALGGLIGARLYHFLLSASGLLDAPANATSWTIPLSWFGGLAGGVAAAAWRARQAGIGVATVAGAAAPALALGYAVGRIGSFMIGADYGVPTVGMTGMTFPRGTPPTTPMNLAREFGLDVPDGAVQGDYVRVHPTQLYEAAGALFVFGILDAWRRLEQRIDGDAGWRLFGGFLVLSGFGRALVEVFRAKPDRLAGPLTVDQIVALGTVALGLVILKRHRRGPFRRAASAPAGAVPPPKRPGDADTHGPATRAGVES